MLGLSMTQLVTMSIGSVLLLIWLIVFAISNKYAPMFQGLDEKEYPMKELYCFGYGLLELFHYSYKKQKHRDLKQQISIFYEKNMQIFIFVLFMHKKLHMQRH